MLLVALVVAAAAPAAALPRTLPPVDQCKSDAGFVQFRNRLRLIASKKDRAGFLALLAPDVLVDFGGATGRDEFAKRWSFDPTEYGNVWDLLETMLKLGCTNSNEVRLIPSLSDQLGDQGADEAFEMRLVLPGAKLFREPGNDRTAKPVAPWTLGMATDSGGDLWTGIRLPDGRTGYISDDDLYEPLGYRMTIEKTAGKWEITTFIAGD